jgi:hypothetical protein
VGHPGIPKEGTIVFPVQLVQKRASGSQQGENKMPHILIRHKVADFQKWKPFYDAHRPVREKAGLKQIHLGRNVANPNEVVILFEGADLERAKAFAGSDDLKRTMQEAGVLGPPDVTFLTAE